MMDEIDLEKPDPKRIGLENDKIIIEYVKNQFQTILELYTNRAQYDLERCLKETEVYKKNILIFQYEQKTLLSNLIGVYQDQLNKLNKDDSL